jgi:hypothetical protein
MPAVGDREPWLAFAQKLYQTGTLIFEQSGNNEPEMSSSDPKLVAVTVLLRTLSNFKGAVALIDQGLIVEARTLVRCCFENLVWIGGLDAKGADFVQEMVQDEIQSKKARGEWLLEWSGNQPEEMPWSAGLQKYLHDLKKGFPKPKAINPKVAAAATTIKDVYLFYSQLSSDAAHISITSLDRHVRMRDDNVLDLIPEASVTEHEVVETLDFACTALMAVCVGANQLVGGTPAGKGLGDLWEEHKMLQSGG